MAKYPSECPVFRTVRGSLVEARPLCSDTGWMADARPMLLIESDGRDFIDPSLLYKYGKCTPLTLAARRLLRWTRS